MKNSLYETKALAFSISKCFNFENGLSFEINVTDMTYNIIKET